MPDWQIMIPQRRLLYSGSKDVLLGMHVTHQMYGLVAEAVWKQRQQDTVISNTARHKQHIFVFPPSHSVSDNSDFLGFLTSNLAIIMRPQEVADKVRGEVEQRTGPLEEYIVDCTTCETTSVHGPYNFKFKMRVGGGRVIHLEIHQASDKAEPKLTGLH